MHYLIFGQITKTRYDWRVRSFEIGILENVQLLKTFEQQQQKNDKTLMRISTHTVNYDQSNCSRAKLKHTPTHPSTKMKCNNFSLAMKTI